MSAEPSAQPTPEDVQHDMADTRRHLGDQAQALGDKFIGMAGDANAAVAGAMRGGKEAVAVVRGAMKNMAASVAAAARQVLDVRGHVRRHPWLAVGCAAALGLVCAGLFRRR